MNSTKITELKQYMIDRNGTVNFNMLTLLINESANFNC